MCDRHNTLEKLLEEKNLIKSKIPRGAGPNKLYLKKGQIVRLTVQT